MCSEVDYNIKISMTDKITMKVKKREKYIDLCCVDYDEEYMHMFTEMLNIFPHRMPKNIWLLFSNETFDNFRFLKNYIECYLQMLTFK